MNSTAADRNLLFGILAVQSGLISRDDFIAAANAWVIDKSKPIRQIFVENGRLDRDQADLFDQMVAMHVRSQGGDVRRSLERLSSTTNLVAPLAAIGDTDIDQSLTFVAGHEPRIAAKFGADHSAQTLKSPEATPPAGTHQVSPEARIPGARQSGPPFVATVETAPNRDDDSADDVRPAPEPRIGDVLGRFRIIRLIGKGGQGIVYEASDESELGRRVALKTTQEHEYDHPEALRARRARLAREGRLNAQLDHPFIMSIYGLGASEAGRPFYAMRFLDQIHLGIALKNFHSCLPLLKDPRGQDSRGDTTTDPDHASEPADSPSQNPPPAFEGTLQIPANSEPVVAEGSPSEAPSNARPSRVDDHPAPSGPVRFDQLRGQRSLDFRNLLERFTDVCDAMHYAHSRRVLHRDLKPGNVMIGTHGETLVIDWGMAKTRAELLAEGRSAPTGHEPDSVSAELDPHDRLSSHGVFIGTPGYAPPEQLAGDLAKLNETTDVYALGMVLFEIVTGQNPFRTDELHNTPRHQWQTWLLTNALAGAPDPSKINASVPKPLAAICRKALAPEQRDRYSSAAALATDVAKWLADEPVTSYRDTARERAQRWTRKNRGKAAALAATVTFLALGGLLTTLFQAQYNQDIKAQRDIALASEKTERQQRELAIANEKEAALQREQAQANAELASQEKARAEENLKNAQWSLYASKLLLAQNAFEAGNGGLALSQLNDCQWNLRGWEHAYLRRQFDSSRQTLYGHKWLVESVAFSADGTRILTGSDNGTAKLWDPSTGRELKSYSIYWTCVAISPDGTRILTGNLDGTAKLRDASTGRELITLKGHSRGVLSVAFSPDGTRILTGSWDGTAKLWDPSTGREFITLKGHSRGVLSVAFSPDATRILTVVYDDTAKLWDSSTGRELITLKGVNSVAISPDGTRILTGSLDGTAKLRDASTGRELMTLKGHSSSVNSVAFSPDGTRILTGSDDGTAKIWDPSSGLDYMTFEGHRSFMHHLAFSPDGTRILTRTWDNTAKLWDLSTRRELIMLKGHSEGVASAAFSLDGTRILTGGFDGTAKLWDPSTGRELITLKGDRTGRHEQLTSVAFSPDGTRIFTGCANGTAKLWDPSTGRELISLNNTQGLWSVAFSPDGTRILTGSVDGTAQLWDASTGRELMTLKGHSETVDSVAFSPGGSRILTKSDDGTAKLWDASTGRELITLKRHSPFNLENSKGRNIRIIAFSPNEKRIVSGFADGHVEFWDIARGREVFDLEAILERSEMRGAAFSPDSKLVYLSDENEKTLAWDTETGQPAPATNPPAKFEMDSVLSPDGRFLAKRMGGKFVLIPQNEPLTGAEPWPLPNRDERLKYHGEQAAASEKSGQWFAAAFHLKRMLTDDSENADLKKRLEAALAQEPNKSGPSAPESANAPDPGQ